jgi:hypothetical protein
VLRPSFKVPIILSILKKTFIFPQICEKYSNIKWHDIHPVGAELFQANGATNRGWTGKTDNMTKLMVAFCNFVSMPKKSQHNSQLLGQESRHSKYNVGQPVTQLHIMSDRQRKCMSIIFVSGNPRRDLS